MWTRGRRYGARAALLLHPSDHRLEGRVHVEQWLPRDARDASIDLVMVGLVPAERPRIINVDEGIATPARSVGVDMLDTFVHTAPVPRSGKTLERLTPCLLEFGLAHRTHVFETLQNTAGPCSPPYMT